MLRSSSVTPAGCVSELGMPRVTSLVDAPLSYAYELSSPSATLGKKIQACTALCQTRLDPTCLRARSSWPTGFSRRFFEAYGAARANWNTIRV